jgi:hypothetical protein
MAEEEIHEVRERGKTALDMARVGTGSASTSVPQVRMGCTGDFGPVG